MWKLTYTIFDELFKIHTLFSFFEKLRIAHCWSTIIKDFKDG